MVLLMKYRENKNNVLETLNSISIYFCIEDVREKKSSW